MSAEAGTVGGGGEQSFASQRAVGGGLSLEQPTPEPKKLVLWGKMNPVTDRPPPSGCPGHSMGKAQVVLEGGVPRATQPDQHSTRNDDGPHPPEILSVHCHEYGAGGTATNCPEYDTHCSAQAVRLCESSLNYLCPP